MIASLRLLLLILPFLSTSSAQNPEFDIWISGGRIIDGAGNPWFIGGIGIRGDTIVYVGPNREVTARQRLDARGKTVTPGFIDTHSHGRRGVFEVAQCGEPDSPGRDHDY